MNLWIIDKKNRKWNLPLIRQVLNDWCMVGIMSCFEKQKTSSFILQEDMRTISTTDFFFSRKKKVTNSHKYYERKLCGDMKEVGGGGWWSLEDQENLNWESLEFTSSRSWGRASTCKDARTGRSTVHFTSKTESADVQTVEGKQYDGRAERQAGPRTWGRWSSCYRFGFSSKRNRKPWKGIKQEDDWVKLGIICIIKWQLWLS